MSLARKTARGAALTILSGIGGRAIGVVGTLVLTRFLAPEVVGPVGVAYIIAMSANWLSLWGWGQYVIVKGKGDDAAEVVWHTTVASLTLGAITLGGIALVGGSFTPYFGVPEAAEYVPYMALGLAIRRVASLPEKLLLKRMQFRPSAAASAVGELTYAVVTICLAAAGVQAYAIVIGNLANAAMWATIIVTAAGLREWLTPTPLRWERFRDMARFGLPLAIETIANNAARYWDKNWISRFFGAAAVGQYQLAYNLADIPAVQVGEQVAMTLLPSMSLLPPERRPAALERSTALLSVLIFPMAVGLGLVAKPLIAVVLSAEWQGVGPLLMVVSVLSIFRPITWVLATYLETQSQTSRLMFLEITKLVLILGGIAVCAPYGILASAGAVGFAFAFNAVAGIVLVSREGPSAWRLVVGFAQPLAACAVMAAAVLAARAGLDAVDISSPVVHLVIGATVGAIVYVAAALVICRETSRDLLRLIRDVISRRRTPDEPER